MVGSSASWFCLLSFGHLVSLLFGVVCSFGAPKFTYQQCSGMCEPACEPAVFVCTSTIYIYMVL